MAKPGRPALAKEIRDLIRRMSVASPTWGSPRILGELRKLGIDLANLVVLNERHLRRHLVSYFTHYHRWRCHQSLQMDCPVSRPVQPPETGKVVEVAEAGGLYRHFERPAA